ncbi:MAG: hypothetical protein ACOY2B_13595 [Pseudomonadota bacterium]
MCSAQTLPATDLNETAKEIGALERAQARAMDADTQSRVWMAVTVSVSFIILNAAMMALIWTAFNADMSLLRDKLIENDQRLITTNIMMSLIGATVVQTGAILFAITGYLFPKK